MAQREDDLDINLSHEFDNGGGDETRGLKQFSECDCEKPIVEPISYVLPDSRFISLVHCKACNGLERYSITELPNGEDASEEKLDTVESLLEDIDSLERENKRLLQKLKRQSRRMRMTQGARFAGGEQAVTPPGGEQASETEETDSDPEQQTFSLQFNSANVSPTGRKVLIASLVLGVGITGAVVWTATALSGAAIMLGTLLIILPVFFLTDGEIPQKQRHS